MSSMHSQADQEGYLLCLRERQDDRVKAWILLDTADFEPLGSLATVLEALAETAKSIAEAHGYVLEERSVSSDLPWSGIHPQPPGQTAELFDYTFAGGEPDCERLIWHLNLMLSGKAVPRPVAVAGMPAREGESRFGREGARAELLSVLDSRSVMLLGPRRGGKTSLLLWLIDDPPPGWAPVYLDLEKLADPQWLVVELCLAFLKQPALATTVSRYEPVGSDLRAPARSEERRWLSNLYVQIGDDWPDLLRHLLESAAGEPRPLLLLDELGDFVEALDGDDFDRFVAALSKLFAAEGPGRAVITGSRSLVHLIDKLGINEAMASFERFPLPPMEPEAARRLLVELLRVRRIRPSLSVIERVLELVGHQVPIFIQMLADDLASAVGAGDLDDPTVVEKIYQEVLLGFPGQAYFNDLERRLKAYGAYHRRRVGQQLLRLVAERGVIEEEELQFKFAADAGGEESLAELLVLLEEHFFLTRSGGRWQFLTPVLRDYARRYYPPSRLT